MWQNGTQKAKDGTRHAGPKAGTVHFRREAVIADPMRWCLTRHPNSSVQESRAEQGIPPNDRKTPQHQLQPQPSRRSSVDMSVRHNMKILTLALLIIPGGLQATIVIIDDFSFAQGPLATASSGGLKQETSDASIYGGYRSMLSNGYVRFGFIDGNIVPGDSSGFSSIDISGGTMSLFKTAYTGSAFVTYEGRAFTNGDRIGDLSMDISSGPLSLASPILYLAHMATASDQIISLSLSSAIDTFSSFDILLRNGTTETIVDLRTSVPIGTGGLGSVDFGNVEDILLGFGNGDPIGSVAIDTFAFIPEPATFSILGTCMAAAFLRRNRNVEQKSAPNAR